MTTARFKALAIVTVTLSAAALGAGCNLEPSVVSKPTYEADVRPIFMARCIRCHGYPTLGDPTATQTSAPLAGLRFDVYGDTNCDSDAGAACVHGAAYEANKKSFTLYLETFPQSGGGMPPPPAPALTTYQKDTVLRWEADPIEK